MTAFALLFTLLQRCLTLAARNLSNHVRDEVVQSLARQLRQGVFGADYQVEHLQEGNSNLGRDVRIDEYGRLKPDFQRLVDLRVDILVDHESLRLQVLVSPEVLHVRVEVIL